MTHIHAELIKAWADGADIERYNPVIGEWRQECGAPEWNTSNKYRVSAVSKYYRASDPDIDWDKPVVNAVGQKAEKVCGVNRPGHPDAFAIRVTSNIDGTQHVILSTDNVYTYRNTDEDVKVDVTGYLNAYKHTMNKAYLGTVHSTRAAADFAARKTMNRVACIPIAVKYTTGEGLD